MEFQTSGRFLIRIAFAAALSIQGCLALGETVAPAPADLVTDPIKRLEWLKARATPPPVRKTYFRTSANRAVAIRTPEATPRAAQPVAAQPPTTSLLSATPAPAEIKPPAAATPESKSAPTRTTPTPAKSRSVETPTSTPRPTTTAGTKAIAATKSPKATSAATPSPTETKILAGSTPEPKTAAAVRATPTPSAKVRAAAAATPTLPIATGPKSIAAKPPTLTTPVLEVRLATPRPVEFKTIARTAPVPRGAADSRYPWKTSIVTTVFWVGEPVGGNNFTHNRSSSWDANWARNFGGFDNPNPDARRSFIAAKFVPRQNPFYIALPYNDVTRGTTKPEARVAIPWFKEAFREEGQSVCRDRWVAVRSQAGKIAYAQWSDCGPFRTDHWQYVFGKEKPKPNLNKGAGLDVSPAVRDYLGLDGTDLTDWKFVDFKDVPAGPWALYGDNNPFTQKGGRGSERAARTGAPGSPEVIARNP